MTEQRTEEIIEQEAQAAPEYYKEEWIEITNEIISEFTNLTFIEPDKHGLEEIVRLVEKKRNNPKHFTIEESKTLLMYLREYYMTPASRNEYFLENSQ